MVPGKLDEVIARYVPSAPLCRKLHMRLTRADEKFRRVTEDSRLCVWHTTPQFDWIGKNLEGCLAEYDRKYIGTTIAGHRMRPIRQGV